MTYSFDGDSTVRHRECSDCGDMHESVSGFVLREMSAHAVFFADWYPHSYEAWIDVILGPWEEPDHPNRVTFGCRIGPVEGQSAPAASLVEGGAIRPDHPMFGLKLDRSAALNHPLLSEFWSIVDWLIINDKTLHENIYQWGR